MAYVTLFWDNINARVTEHSRDLRRCCHRGVEGESEEEGRGMRQTNSIINMLVQREARMELLIGGVLKRVNLVNFFLQEDSIGL